jgi:hypothetical protein
VALLPWFSISTLHALPVNSMCKQIRKFVIKIQEKQNYTPFRFKGIFLHQKRLLMWIHIKLTHEQNRMYKHWNYLASQVYLNPLILQVQRQPCKKQNMNVAAYYHIIQYKYSLYHWPTINSSLIQIVSQLNWLSDPYSNRQKNFLSWSHISYAQLDWQVLKRFFSTYLFFAGIFFNLPIRTK